MPGGKDEKVCIKPSEGLACTKTQECLNSLACARKLGHLLSKRVKRYNTREAKG